MEHYQFVICNALWGWLLCACPNHGAPIKGELTMQFYCEKAVLATLISLNCAMWVLLIMAVVSWFEG